MSLRTMSPTKRASQASTPTWAEGLFENPRVGFADADNGAGIDADGEEFEQVVQLEVFVEDEAGDEGVGDEGELEAAM